jgi:hypothetical protein
MDAVWKKVKQLPNVPTDENTLYIMRWAREEVSDEQVEAVILAMIDLKMIPLPVERGDIPTWQEKLAAEPSSDLACLRDEDPLT